MKYFPDHSLIMNNALIVRERYLPDGIYGEVLKHKGETVNPADEVARGTRPSDYVIIDVAGALGIDPGDEASLNEMITVKVDRTIKAGTPMGEPQKRSLRRRMPKAPADAVVKLIDHGRVILQVNPETVTIKARVPGMVVNEEPGRGVTIESYGAVLQCAWGNGQFASAAFDFEPGATDSRAGSDIRGMAAMMGMDISLSPYRGKVVILMRPLVEDDFPGIVAQELTGIVAPSAAPDLRKKAMQLKVPVILTEGFGNLPPTAKLYEFLDERRNSHAVFNAASLDFRNNVHPEIILPGGTTRQNAQPPGIDTPLRVGMTVRLRRAPYAGLVATIIDLPELPVQLGNGLRLPCAQVRLQTGEKVMIPYANLASLGEVS
ncbi:MAG TPA: hypothetical protein VJZ27_15930 [Aggregatilineales bacterium]|nr:hypothetical protein [Aggregatilineales bacterium]